LKSWTLFFDIKQAINKKNNSKVNNVTNKVTTALFMIYLVALNWILLFKLGVQFSYMKSRGVNLIPFSKPLIVNGKIDPGEIILML
jgi:glycopeptide antibiotics resistance protein